MSYWDSVNMMPEFCAFAFLQIIFRWWSSYRYVCLMRGTAQWWWMGVCNGFSPLHFPWSKNDTPQCCFVCLINQEKRWNTLSSRVPLFSQVMNSTLVPQQAQEIIMSTSGPCSLKRTSLFLLVRFVLFRSLLLHAKLSQVVLRYCTDAGWT